MIWAQGLADEYVCYWVYLLLCQPLGVGVIRAVDTGPIAFMPLFALPLMGLGLLISAWARTLRAAVVEIAEPLVRPVSAMGHLAAPVEALLRQGSLEPGVALAALGLTGVTLVVSLVVAWRRGA